MLNVPVFVMEEGYIRPGFITLERGGVNALSSTLSRYRLDHDIKDKLSDPVPVRRHKRRVVWHAMWYYAHLQLNGWRYPNYLHHRQRALWRNARYWVASALNIPLSRWHDRDARKSIDERYPIFFVPLQLDSDAQIVHHSRFSGVIAFVDEVLNSFSLHAPSEARLLIKQHPLALGNIRMRRKILDLAVRYGLSDRVIFIHACKIHELLDKVAGVVTVNSTVGVQAIFHGTPLKILGEAVYDEPGIVDEQPLDSFWLNPFRPDPEKAAQYHRSLKVLTQVPAALYDPASHPLVWNALLFGVSRRAE
jgi:capsule polysaccharide modification protein KpsS